MNDKLRISLTGLLAVSLSACTASALPKYERGGYIYTSHNPAYYLRAQAAPPLMMPEGLDDPNIDDVYAIPDAPPAGSKPVSLIPPGSLAEARAMAIYEKQHPKP